MYRIYLKRYTYVYVDLQVVRGFRRDSWWESELYVEYGKMSERMSSLRVPDLMVPGSEGACV